MNTSAITRFATRSVLKVRKNSPQILFVAGIVGTVATTVLASRATLKAQPVVVDMAEERKALEAKYQRGGFVSTQEYGQEVAEQYTITAIQLTKLYGPVVVLGVASIAALTKSHRQLTSRNTALTVAYTGLFKTFEKYRSRVRDQLGDGRDQEFLHGTVQQELVMGQNKDGTDKVKSITVLDPDSDAENSVYFDDSVPSWTKDPGYNQRMLDGQEAWANWKLQKDGHLFLNEVLESLRLPHTKAGAIVGWVYKDLGTNDSHVSFGHHLDNDFFAGYKKDVMLNFNVMGSILDLI